MQKEIEIIKNENNIPLSEYIIDDYFDFEFHDISLKQLSLKLKELNFKDNDFSEIKELYEKKIFPQLKISLSTIESPYLNNLFKYYFEQNSNNTNYQKGLLFTLLSHKDDISIVLENFFLKLIRFNNLGISNSIKTILSKEITDSEKYKLFEKQLSKWHCHIEFILFYIDYILSNYNKNFVFNKKLFEIENNQGSYSNIIIKKSLYKLSSTICSKISLNSQIDYKKILLYITLSLQYGFSLSNLFSFFPKSQLNNFATSFAFNFLMGKLSSKLEHESLFVEFNIICQNIEKLNMNLFNIENYLYQFILLEVRRELDEKLGLNVNKLKNNIKKLSIKIEYSLKNLDFDEDILNTVEEEYVLETSQITMEEIENSIIESNKKDTDKK